MKFSFTILFVSCVVIAKSQGVTVQASENGVIASSSYSTAAAISTTKRLNQLLAQYGGKNATIVLPAGRIWINEPLHIPSRTRLTGHSKGSIIAIAPQFAASEEGFLENENYNLGNLKTDSLITLDNFTIEGDSVVPVKGQPRGVFLNKVSNATIRNLTILRTILEGIRIDCSHPKIQVKHILIEGCTVERRGLILQNIILRSYTEDPFNSQNLAPCIVGVVIQNNLSIGGFHGIAAFNSKNIVIRNNTCISNAHRGIIASPTAEDFIIKKNRVDSAGSTGIHIAYYSKNVFIDSNVISNTIADMSGKGGEGQCIKAYMGFSNIKITNNICRGAATDGIALEGGGSGDQFLVSGNTCENNKRNGVRIWAGKLYFQKGFDIQNGNVTKNKLANNGEEGVFIGSDNNGISVVRKVTVKGNKIKARAGKKKFRIDFIDKSIKVYN